MRFFKTRFERIYLGLSIGFIFFMYYWILDNYIITTGGFIKHMFFYTMLPFVPYVMYKLIFKKEENNSNSN